MEISQSALGSPLLKILLTLHMEFANIVNSKTATGVLHPTVQSCQLSQAYFVLLQAPTSLPFSSPNPSAVLQCLISLNTVLQALHHLPIVQCYLTSSSA